MSVRQAGGCESWGLQVTVVLGVLLGGSSSNKSPGTPTGLSPSRAAQLGQTFVFFLSQHKVCICKTGFRALREVPALLNTVVDLPTVPAVLVVRKKAVQNNIGLLMRGISKEDCFGLFQPLCFIPNG